MNKLTQLSLLLAVTMLSPPALAHGEPRSGSVGNQSMQMHGGAGVMSDEDYDEMYEHMEAMQTLMQDAMTEQDPQKHAQLMQKHWGLMQKNMHMMNGGMGMMGGTGTYGSMMNNGHQGMGMMGNNAPAQRANMDQTGDIETRIHRLEERLGMMQLMLQQFMEREAEQSRLPGKK